MTEIVTIDTRNIQTHEIGQQINTRKINLHNTLDLVFLANTVHKFRDQIGINVRDLTLQEKEKYYNLLMFPYPSAEGMHIGNFYAFTGGDINGRYHTLKGFHVYQPMGYDSFGIHTENFAHLQGVHPKILTNHNIANFRKQFDCMGARFDRQNSITTSDSEFYRWNQDIFIRLYNAGLAYKKTSLLNRCPECQTVISDEQVEGGKCERHKETIVEKKETEQWFLRLSSFSDELYESIDQLDRSEKTKLAQKNWIGLIEGFSYKVETSSGEELDLFCKEKDEISYEGQITIAPDSDFVKGKLDPMVISKLINENKFQKSLKRSIKLEGVFAYHPLTNKQIPIYVTNDYTSDDGYELVYQPNMANKLDIGEGATPVEPITVKKFRLRDWCVSRQRYRGTPIPMVLCDTCGIQPEIESNLPIVLPELENTKPTGELHGPLADVGSFVKTSCPCCGGNAKRETHVLDNFFDSARYYFRYLSGDSNQAFDPELVKKWMPVDAYIGGNEHAVGHLMFSRFMTKAFKKMGLIDFDEPFKKFVAHGLIVINGAKMSKSKGNVINPDAFIKEYGADALRMSLMFIGAFTQGGDFSVKDTAGKDPIAGFTNSIHSTNKFLNKIVDKVQKTPVTNEESTLPDHAKLLVNKIITGYENYKYNVCIAGLMERFNKYISKQPILNTAEIEKFLTLLSPICPIISEYLRTNTLGKSGTIHQASGSMVSLETLEVLAQEKYIIKVNNKHVESMQFPQKINKQQIFNSLLGNTKLNKALNGKTFSLENMIISQGNNVKIINISI